MPSLSLIVEFDGYYWHREASETDAAKVRLLSKAGWRVIRVRESPLDLTSPMDVAVPAAATAKVVADEVLTRVLELDELVPLEPATRERIWSYIEGSEARASKAAEQLIRRIIVSNS